MTKTALVVIETHPVQYHAPVYRLLQTKCGIPVTVIYGSDFSVVGYRDREFGAAFAWDTDLLTGYKSIFLSHANSAGIRAANGISTRGLREALQEAAPGVVLLMGYRSRFDQEAFYRSWKARCPIFFRGETTDHTKQRGFIHTWARDRLLRWFYSQCSTLFYIGQRSYQHYKRLGVRENKLIFSPYGVDTSAFLTAEEDRNRLRSIGREEIQAGEGEIVILFSGKMVLRKRPNLLMGAIKRLEASLRNRIRILFVGSGELEEKLKRAALSEPVIRVLFAGFKNQSELSRYYHAADLLALPSSSSETWGLVVNEALHHGVPCVVSDQVGCAPDLIEGGKTGEVFKGDSLKEFAQAIARALPLTNRLEIREKCRQKVSGYTMEKAAESIEKAYRAIVTKGD